MDHRALMGLFFYPRGGSAQVARYLSRALTRRGAPLSLITGSLGTTGQESHARTFFGDIDLQIADYTPALEAFRRGRDPIAEPVPLHPSYEDRVDSPDRIFTAVSPQLAEHLVTAWQRLLRKSKADSAAVFHLHHLTVQHEAVARSWPDRPIIAHLHGTELRMVERIAGRMAIARKLGTDLAGMAARVERVAPAGNARLSEEQRRMLESTRWTQWRYGEFWA